MVDDTLTIVDDYSRYAVGLEDCDNEQDGTVQRWLEQTFGRYGMTDDFFVDNGTLGAIYLGSAGPVWACGF